MNLFPYLFAFGISCTSLVSAELHPFSNAEEVRDLFEVKTDPAALKLQPEGSDTALLFAPQKTASSVLIYGGERDRRELEAPGAAIDFCIRQYGSFGLYVRGSKDRGGTGAYLILVNQERGNRGKLRVFKNAIWPQRYPENDLLGQQDLRKLPPAVWYRLEVKTVDQANGIPRIEGRLIEPESGTILGDIIVEDTVDPLPTAGQIALRLYVEKPGKDGIELKNFVISTEK